MKKLLLVATRLFWPTDSGRKVSLYHYCKGLHEKYGYDIYVYSFLEAGQTDALIDDKPDFIKEVRLAKPIGGLKKLTNLFFRSLFGGWALQNSLYYSGGNVCAIKKYAKEVAPEVVIVDMVRLAPYFKAIKKLPAKKILDLDDLLSKRYLRQAAADENHAQILGTYGGYASFSSKKILSGSKSKQFVLKTESKRVRRAEIKYGKLYDGVIFVSEKETAEFNALLGAEKAVTVRLGVDYDYYSGGESPEKEKGAIAFLGNMRFAPNVDSLHFIAAHILPALDFDYKLYVLGVCPDEIMASYKNNERIVFLGMVEDVRPVIKKCELFLSPIAYGTGVKTKILEAMAMGVPVVTNSVGAEGIDAQYGVHFLVENSAAETAMIVNGLIGNKEKLAELAENGQKLAKEKYRWEEIYGSFAALGFEEIKGE
ncbi:MAG: glycosyltransferase [Clostridia bacterium]|nr:glycosyltransferase [Clostridia bacterium]